MELAKTEDEAIKKYDSYKEVDPFPIIPPALLHSGDILNYVMATGLIFPFNPNNLKSASYQMGAGKEVLYWDQDKKIYSEDAKQIKLRPNSITYVSVESQLRIPNYIALRFNLTITHVHRGILLGTGPLIDPGFDGKLMIPIHNLTPNEYIITPGQHIIAIEFTKLSYHSSFTSKNPIKNYEEMPYIPFKKLKSRSFDEYIEKSLDYNHNGVESSIGDTLDKITSDFHTERKKLKDEIDKHKKRELTVAVSSIIAIVLAFAGTWALILDANKYVADAVNIVNTEQKKKEKIEELLKKENENTVKINTIIDEINEKINEINKKIDK